jgi:DUF4097 and DUF4098 domain-containing protein YvlB
MKAPRACNFAAATVFLENVTLRGSPMYTRTARLSLVLILGLVASASWGADKTFDQHFTAPPGGRLMVDTDVGAITISGHDSRDLTVHVDISGSNADNIKFSAAQTASGVTVTGRSSDSSWFHLGSNWNRVKIMIEAPRDYPVELKTAGGGLDVRGINAEVQGSTSGGGIDLHDIAGPIDLRTSGGGIDAHNLKGSVRLRSSGGAIEISDVTGDLDVHTSGGGIDLDNIDGRINADTSGGGVRVAALSNHGITLSTSGGPVTLLVPSDVHAFVDAETSGGRVHSDLPVTVTDTLESNHLRGQINGGGERISIHSSGGGIRIGSLTH